MGILFIFLSLIFLSADLLLGFLAACDYCSPECAFSLRFSANLCVSALNPAFSGWFGMENASAWVGFAAVWVGPELAYGRQNRPDPGGKEMFKIIKIIC